MAQKVVVTVTPDGQTIVAVKGCPGKACKDLTQTLEKALGEVSADNPTPEMQQHVQPHNTQNLARG